MTLQLVLLSLALAAFVYVAWNLTRQPRQTSPAASVLIALVLFVTATFVVAMLQAVTGGWAIPGILITACWITAFGVLLMQAWRRRNDNA
jgi:hypothetical protein